MPQKKQARTVKKFLTVRKIFGRGVGVTSIRDAPWARRPHAAGLCHFFGGLDIGAVLLQASKPVAALTHLRAQPVARDFFEPLRCVASPQ